MLEVHDLYVGYYKDLNILQGIAIKAETGKITAVLGANGVGKSTLQKSDLWISKTQCRGNLYGRSQGRRYANLQTD